MPMKIWKHFKTITYHKYLVMKGCFRVGLYKQGLLHDMSKYTPSEFLLGQGTIKATGALIMLSGKILDIPLHGSTTKAGTNTIMNTGSTTVPKILTGAWPRRPCRKNMWWKC